MTSVRIAHLRKRYRVRADTAGERQRLDRVWQSAIDDELFDAALERAGIPADEEVCIRRVDSVVRLDAARADASLAVEWTVALADAIAQRVSDGGQDVVRYRSRYLAVVDMACSATNGDLARAWAWRSLRIWRGADVVDADEARLEVIAALAREPRLAPAVLRVVARRGLLPRLVSSVSGEVWVALAHAALVEWGAGEFLARRFLAGHADVAAENSAADLAVTHASAVEQAVSRIFASSALVGAAIAAWPTEWPDRAAIAHALAVLALLAVEPALVRSARGVPVVQRLAARMAAGRALIPPKALTTSTGRKKGHEEGAKGNVRDDARAHDDVVAHDPTAHDPREHDAYRTHEDARACAATSWGGLLFLLHIVSALDLPAVLLADRALGARSLRWTLHQLATLLIPLSKDDPAALAFAGLAPGSRTPCADEPPSTEAESAALRSAHAAIVASLREIMRAPGVRPPAEDSGTAEESGTAAQSGTAEEFGTAKASGTTEALGTTAEECDTALLQRVASRSADIIAEQAWIELRLSAAEVSTSVRRGGLDLDPGWIPWLGVVVRFVYV